MANADRSGLPLAVCIESASPHEVTLVEPLADEMLVTDELELLIGEMTYDSDGLDERLKARGVETIASSLEPCPASNSGWPANATLSKVMEVERLFAWLQSFRRILVRHEFPRCELPWLRSARMYRRLAVDLYSVHAPPTADMSRVFQSFAVFPIVARSLHFGRDIERVFRIRWSPARVRGFACR